MLKKLIEDREQKQKTLETILEKAKTEERAMSVDEVSEFDKLEGEIGAIDATISAEKRARNLSDGKPKEKESESKSVEETEERAFESYVLDAAENRATGKNLTMSQNGAIIPTTIANRIIKEVKDLCPIFKKATIYNIKGTLKVPVWGASDSHNIAVGFQEEFTEITADAGKFASIDLGGYLVGALTLIGKSVENNGSFSVVNFIVSQMAEEISAFLEGIYLKGSTGKTEGALSTTNTLTSASATAVTTDELIELQAKVKQCYQAGACWTMNPATFTAIRKLKDGNGRYLLQDDITGEFPYRLLGKPVYISDNMPIIAVGAKAVLYGDYSGLSINMRENISIQVLREKYATQHAIGVVAWLETDSKVTDNQKLAILVMKA